MDGWVGPKFNNNLPGQASDPTYAFQSLAVNMRGYVMTPPGYDPKARATYPTVYFIPGYGGTADNMLPRARQFYAAMAAKRGAVK